MLTVNADLSTRKLLIILSEFKHCTFYKHFEKEQQFSMVLFVPQVLLPLLVLFRNCTLK